MTSSWSIWVILGVCSGAAQRGRSPTQRNVNSRPVGLLPVKKQRGELARAEETRLIRPAFAADNRVLMRLLWKRHKHVDDRPLKRLAYWVGAADSAPARLSAEAARRRSGQRRDFRRRRWFR